MVAAHYAGYRRDYGLGRQDRRQLSVAVTRFLMVICVLIVALRMYVRAKVIKKVGLDDWMIVVALVR